MKENQTEKKSQEKYEERIIRILSQDIPGNMAIYPGLTRIKGISWGISNAICEKLKLDKNQKFGSLTKDEITKISDFIKNLKVPGYLANRKKDPETGEDRHLTAVDLELRRDFDIKRLRKIRSYRGLRHTLGLPTRGQRTKGHFRKNKGKSVGIKKKSKKTQIK